MRIAVYKYSWRGGLRQLSADNAAMPLQHNTTQFCHFLSLEAGIRWEAHFSTKNLRTYVFLEPTWTEYQGPRRRPTWHYRRLTMRDRWVIYGHPLFVFDQTRRESVEWRDSKRCQILGADSIIIGSIVGSFPAVIRRCDDNTESSILDDIAFSPLNRRMRLRKVYLIVISGFGCVDNYWRKIA